MYKNLKSLNILLIEDELEIQQHYKEVFEYFFHKVYTASNGKEALKVYDKENISAIFTDYEMPLMNGFELILEIREKNKNIPIIILSNHDDKEKLQKCIPLGLVGYLFKPLSYEDIKNYLINNSEKILEHSSLEYIFSDNIKVNFSEYTLEVDDKKHIITKLESAFLELMSQNENKVVTYDAIFDYLDQFDATFSTIKNLVYRLKTKYQFNFIKNIKDVGYILVKDV